MVAVRQFTNEATVQKAHTEKYAPKNFRIDAAFCHVIRIHNGIVNCTLK